MIASGYAWPIVEAHVKYVHAARFNDRLAVQASLVEWQNRLTVNYLITNAATAERVARARTVQVAVAASTGVLQFATPAVLLERVAAATRGERKWNDAM
jgi:acyl-CoA thioester hydrolase